MALHFNRTPVASIAQLLPLYPAKEFGSPTRSTVPLLSMLTDPAWHSVVTGLPCCGSALNIHTEYTVMPPTGRGLPSCTDVMLCSPDHAVAIEAKWTEPRYPATATWLQQGGNPQNRQAVLDGWVKLVQSYVGQSWHAGQLAALPYQMVHRAASACYAATTETLTPVMAYLQFICPPWRTPACPQHLFNDLTAFHALLGRPVNFPFYLFEVTMQPTTAWSAIAQLPKQQASTATAVQTALLNGPLFTFSSVVIHTIQ